MLEVLWISRDAQPNHSSCSPCQREPPRRRDSSDTPASSPAVQLGPVPVPAPGSPSGLWIWHRAFVPPGNLTPDLLPLVPKLSPPSIPSPPVLPVPCATPGNVPVPASARGRRHRGGTAPVPSAMDGTADSAAMGAPRPRSLRGSRRARGDTGDTGDTGTRAHTYLPARPRAAGRTAWPGHGVRPGLPGAQGTSLSARRWGSSAFKAHPSHPHLRKRHPEPAERQREVKPWPGGQ